MNFNKKEIFKLFHIELFPTVIFLSLILLYLFNPLSNLLITSFDRTIGVSLLTNISIEKRIYKFYLWYLIFLPLIFLITYYLVNYIYIYSNKPTSFLFINDISSISLIPLAISFINRFNKFNLDFSILFPLCIVILFLLYFLFKGYAFINFSDYKWCILLSLSILQTAFTFLNFSGLNIKFNMSIYVIFFISFIFITIFISYIIARLIHIGILTIYNFDIIKLSMIPILCGSGLTSLYIELTNILNQYYIFLRKSSILFIYLLLLVFSIMIYIFLKNRNKIYKHFKWENIYYPILILSMVLITVQPSLQTYVDTDLFESANYGLTISEFFNYGKFPIIETFDAHMMRDSIWGIIYGILNSDKFGAIFIVYGKYIIPILFLIFYKILKEFFLNDFAFFLVLLFPSSVPFIWSDFSFVSIILLIYAMKRNTLKSYILYWASLVIICLYSLDTGFAYSIATIGTFLLVYYFNIIKKFRVSLKNWFISFVVVMATCFVVYVSICYIKNINFILRIREFIAIANSNINWAYSSIGDTNLMIFSVTYIFIPFSVVLSLIILIYLIKFKNYRFKLSNLAIIISLGIAYIVNIQRTLVRHSVVELQINILFFSSILFLTLLYILITDKYKKQKFLILFSVATIFVTLLKVNTNFNSDTLINSAFNNCININIFEEIITHKVERVVLSDNMKERTNNSIKVINNIINSDETYLDFTNNSLLYALSGKEKPVYVNQSPGLVSGEFAQEQFINQIDKNKEKVTFALMSSIGGGIDGIQNSYRYYKISEYISNNFRPLCTFDNYALWCRKEKFNDISLRVLDKLGYLTSKIDLNEKIINELQLYDLDIYYNNNKFVINSGKIDPQINNFETIVNDCIKKEGLFEILIEYETDNSGVIQMFYTKSEHEKFGELKENVITNYINSKKGKISFLIPFTKYTLLRLDVPDESNFIISNIYIKEVNNEEPYYTICDYDYGDINSLHSYNLGQIPYIWGMYDIKKSFNNEVIAEIYNNVENIYSINTNNFSKQRGNYLLLDISSQVSGNCTITFGETVDLGKGEIEFLAENYFNFKINEGINNRYLIRVSSDFFWYTNQINSFKVETDIDIQNIKFSFLSGD